MKEVKGDLIKLALKGEFSAIVHGCNCFNVMGSGIAPKINSAFLGVPAEADNTTVPGDMSKLGTISVGRHGGLYIVNAYTQYGTARFAGECVVDYDAIRSSFAQVARLARLHDNGDGFKIGYPMIGAGLAGGDWKLISHIIDEQLEGLDHTLVIFDPTA